jgi:hypothetical protein
MVILRACFIVLENKAGKTDVRKYLSPFFNCRVEFCDGLCGLVVRVPDYRPRGSGFDSRIPVFLRSSGPGTGSTQSRVYN